MVTIMRSVILLSCLNLVWMDCHAREQSFYLPSSSRDKVIHYEVFKNLNPGMLSDFIKAHGRWIRYLEKFEKNMQRSPGKIRGTAVSEKVLTFWELAMSKEMVFLARGYRWLEASSRIIEGQARNQRVTSTIAMKKVNDWALGADRVLQSAVSAMEEYPSEYPLLVIVLSGIGNESVGVNPRARRRWQAQMQKLKYRQLQVRQYLKRRIHELRVDIQQKSDR